MSVSVFLPWEICSLQHSFPLDLSFTSSCVPVFCAASRHQRLRWEPAGVLVLILGTKRSTVPECSGQTRSRGQLPHSTTSVSSLLGGETSLVHLIYFCGVGDEGTVNHSGLVTSWKQDAFSKMEDQTFRPKQQKVERATGFWLLLSVKSVVWPQLKDMNMHSLDTVQDKDDTCIIKLKLWWGVINFLQRFYMVNT